jgi:hypothetical protein
VICRSYCAKSRLHSIIHHHSINQRLFTSVRSHLVTSINTISRAIHLGEIDIWTRDLISVWSHMANPASKFDEKWSLDQPNQQSIWWAQCGIQIRGDKPMLSDMLFTLFDRFLKNLKKFDFSPGDSKFWFMNFLSGPKSPPSRVICGEQIRRFVNDFEILDFFKIFDFRIQILWWRSKLVLPTRARSVCISFSVFPLIRVWIAWTLRSRYKPHDFIVTIQFGFSFG